MTAHPGQRSDPPYAQPTDDQRMPDGTPVTTPSPVDAAGRVTTNTDRPLRLAVLTSDGVVHAWHAAVLARMPQELASVVARVDLPSPQTSRGRHPRMSRLWRRYVRHRLDRPGRALERREVDDILGPVPAVLCAPGSGPKAARRALPHAALEHVARYGCDFVLNLTDLAVNGVPEDGARLGLWEYRVRPDERTGPARRANASTAPALLRVDLVRVGGAADEDRVLGSAWVHSIPHSVAATIDNALFTTVELVARACRETLLSGTTAARGVASREPQLLDDHGIVRAALTSPVRKLHRVARGVVWQEEWHLGVVAQRLEDIFASRTLETPTWFENPSPRFYLADPFGVDGSDVVLAEAYDYLTHTGHIAAVEIGDGTQHPVARPVMRTGGHMSYPYMFHHDGDIYCIPETSDRRQATLHRAVSYPDDWEQVGVLVDGLAVTDPTVVRFDGTWWLFCTDDELGPGSNLHVFHAEELTGPWTAHSLNPVKIDIRSSRPAGTPFEVDGRLIRPAQNNSKGYGSGVVFNRVDVLKPTEFREHPVFLLEPPADDRHRFGLHTVAPWGDATLIDGKRLTLSPLNLAGRGLQLVR